MSWGRHKKELLHDKPKITVPPSAPPAPSVPISEPAQPAASWNPPMVTSVFSAWADPSPYRVPPGRDEDLIVSGTECPAYRPWAVMRTPDRFPAINQYDERDLAVEKWRLEKMVEGKWNVACRQVGWSWQHTAKLPPWVPAIDPLLYRWAVDNHMALPGSGVQFCLSNWDAVAGTSDGPGYHRALQKDRGWTLEDFVESNRLFARAVGGAMLHPDYWRLFDRPVLYRGWAHTLPWYKEKFGYDITARQIVSIWKEEILALTGREPLLVATSTDPEFHRELKGCGFDILTQYLLHSMGWTNTMGVYRYWWARDLATCRAQGLFYIVPATAGYDGAAWDTDESKAGFRHIPTAAEFLAHIREARKLARDNRDVCVAVGEYAWSEHGEGGIEEPQLPGMLHDGDEIMKAHALACS